MKKISYEIFFTTLAGNRRLEIVRYLQQSGKKNVTDIAAGTGIEQSAVSHNLNKLLTCQFVHIEVQGKHRYYSLNEDTVLPLLKLVDRHITKYCQGDCQDCNDCNTASHAASNLT